MSKRKTDWTEKKFKRYIEEGRGQGEGKDYKPWLNVQDFPSKGRATRVSGWKTNRIHHYFSDNETRYHFLLDWFDQVIDIQEQFPLLELSEATKIAEDMGVKYPTDPKTNHTIILTTDFLITLKSDKDKKYIARTIKPHKELDKQTVLKKFEIERRYWLKHNIDWGIVTEQEIPLKMVKNIEWVHTAYWLEPKEEFSLDNLLELITLLKNKLEKNRDGLLQKVLHDFDNENKLEKGLSLYLFRHLIARKEVILDISEEININMPLERIRDIVPESNYFKESMA